MSAKQSAPSSTTSPAFEQLLELVGRSSQVDPAGQVGGDLAELRCEMRGATPLAERLTWLAGVGAAFSDDVADIGCCPAGVGSTRWIGAGSHRVNFAESSLSLVGLAM